MPPSVHGIHHVTAIAGDAQENLDFYVGVLGMRLVKRSVNQDDPGTYHLFYADGAGTPGTDLTFFPWPQLPPTQLGVGLTVELSLAIPPGSLTFWQERLDRAGVACRPPERRFGERTLPFTDPHGLPLALAESADPREWVAWDDSPVPPPHQVRGLHAVRLWERDPSATEAVLTQLLGFAPVAIEDGWHRFGVAGGASGTLIEVRAMAGQGRGQPGVGGIHHVAWRVRDAEEEIALQQRLAAARLRPTSPIDRFWFRSVYFREPGGALWELATDGPGFDRDEPLEQLGERLILPPWLESDRRDIEAALPPLVMPG